MFFISISQIKNDEDIKNFMKNENVSENYINICIKDCEVINIIRHESDLNEIQ